MKLGIFSVVIFIGILGNVFAQWQPDVRLTNNPSASFTSFNNAWCVAASDNIVHIVWYDNRDENEEIYYKRSTDDGVNWGADTRLTINAASSAWPSVAINGQVVHVTWEDTRDGNYEIYYKRSTDAGVSWGTDTRLTVNSAISANTSVASSNLAVHVVWVDDRDGNLEIYSKSSTNSGESWLTETRLTNNSSVSENASVSVSGAVVHVVWDDNLDGNYEIYYKRSTDQGISWSADTRLTHNSSVSAIPSLSVSGSDVHVAITDNRDGNWEIYYKHSTDGGISWGSDIRLTNNSAESWYSSVAVSGSSVHVVWHDTRDANEEIYYKRSTDKGIIWEADTRLTNNDSISKYSSISVSDSTVNVIWCDSRDGNNEIYYKRDPSGNVTGIENIVSELLQDYRLEQNYPNPFNPSTTIQFSIPEQSFVKLELFNTLGEKITTLVSKELNAGNHKYEWNPETQPGGVYFYKLSTNSFQQTKKLVLLK